MPVVVAQDGTFNGGRRQAVSFVGSVARTDTSNKNLFTLPAGCIPTNILIASTAPSNAGTTATLSVGTVAGAVTDFLNALDVKTAGTGGGSQKPTGSASTKFGVPLAADTVVDAVYAETGGASSSGGPWIVIIEALVN